MLDLALSILCSSLIFVIFKLFTVYKIETVYAIIANYVVACLCGFYFYNGDVEISEIPQKDWFWGTLALGILFILVFNLTAATAQKVGVSVASVAMKMSLVIPVIFGVAVYHEKLGVLKVLGIILALVAVYFVSHREKSAKIRNATLLLPLLVFIGSGVIDTSLKYIQEAYVAEVEFPLFSATVFAAAGVTGLVLISLKSFKKRLKINLRNILGGIALGVVNYFSIFFLLRALQNESLNSASVFTINNVAIVMFSTLLGILLFKEKLSLKNRSGIALAVISILLVALF